MEKDQDHNERLLKAAYGEEYDPDLHSYNSIHDASEVLESEWLADFMAWTLVGENAFDYLRLIETRDEYELTCAYMMRRTTAFIKIANAEDS